ncbi:MAG: DsrE/DsrF/DrsH-like family protein [Spirochaetaceae bacterium]|nr:DsrE/DsrF/DrsH-like family protein [Spirochaetaceae bacterium]
MSGKDEAIKKISLVCSKGSLDGVYPALIMANGARMEGIEVSIFFTFFGMDAITKKKMNKIKIATVGNPGMGMPTWLGAIPGMSAMATFMMMKTMDKLDIPSIPEFIEMISDSGGKIYACKASVDMFGLAKDDFCPQVDKILTVGEFYELSAGAEIIFT